MRQMLDAVAEYERQLIVSRTTRGLRKRINEGKRVHAQLYGYDRNGKDKDGRIIWIPVESELNIYQYALKRYLEGTSLLKICYELYDMNKVEKREFPHYSSYIGKILRKYQYTGYQLTVEGYEIYKKFRKNEMENLNILTDRKYWVKSYNYPIELISIENWIIICEKLQIQSRNFANSRKDRLLRASKDIATGIIECHDCGTRFYYQEQKSLKKKNGELKVYLNYYHMSRIDRKVCKQRPRSVKLDHINEVFKLFYFYFKVVFDNKAEQTNETLRNIKQTQLKLSEKIKKIENEISIREKRILKYTNVIENTDDKDAIIIISRQINENEITRDNLHIELSQLRIEKEKQNEKYDQTELEMTYDDVKEKVNDWFFNLNIEEQRNELIRNIHACKIFNHYLLIDTGKIIFLFDINKKDVFDMTLLENLNKDFVYKTYFVEMKGKKEARKFNEKLIHNIDLNRNKETRMRVFQYLIKTYNIVYDISEKTNLISFVPLTGLLGFEVEQFGNEG